MKETNTNEELFDGLFRENLGNASTPPPAGVWEGISSSIGSSSAATTAAAAVKVALWMKAAIAVTAITVASVIVYQSNKNEVIAEPVKSETIVSAEKNLDPNINIQNNETPNTENSGSLDISSHINKDNVTEVDPEVSERTNFNTEIEQEPVKSDVPKYVIKVPDLEDEWKNNPQSTPVNPTSTKQSDNDSIEENAVIPQPEAYAGVDSSYIDLSENAFTPNGDGIGDLYLIKLVGEEKVEITIYNKQNGNVVFKTTNKYIGWTGNLSNGQPAPEGNYLVIVTYKFKGKDSDTKRVQMVLIR